LGYSVGGDTHSWALCVNTFLTTVPLWKKEKNSERIRGVETAHGPLLSTSINAGVYRVGRTDDRRTGGKWRRWENAEGGLTPKEYQKVEKSSTFAEGSCRGIGSLGQ